MVTTCTVPDCNRDHEAKGLCHSHFESYRRHGVMPTKPILDTLEARFMAKVVKQENGCWLWTGATDGDGRYGAIMAWSKVRRAHRVAYELFRGPIPDSLSLDHLCKRTLCVNPEHLEPVTHKVNVLRGDAPSSANAVKTHCPRGHPYDITLKSGGRWCSICARESARVNTRAYRARLKAKR